MQIEKGIGMWNKLTNITLQMGVALDKAFLTRYPSHIPLQNRQPVSLLYQQLDRFQ